MYDVCVIGHITKDIVRIKNEDKKEMPGGVAYYFSMGLMNLGSNISLITKAAEKDDGLWSDLNKKNITIFDKTSTKTTVFENIYPEDFDFRKQNVKQIAKSFSKEDIQNISAQIFHLGPLTKEDIPIEILKVLSEKGNKISLDVQGFLRKSEIGEVKSVDWEEKDEGLAYVDILKTDETEAKILSGEDNIKKAAKKLAKHGIDEIIVTRGSEGSLIYSNGEYYSIPSFPGKKIVDVTGCGDTYMAGYIYKRLKKADIDESGRFAAAMASLKLEESGPFKRSEEDVQNFLKSQSKKKVSK